MRTVTPKKYRYGKQFIIGVVLQTFNKLEDVKDVAVSKIVILNRREIKDILYLFEQLDHDRFPGYRQLQRRLVKTLNKKERKSLHRKKQTTGTGSRKSKKFLRGSREALENTKQSPS